MGKMAFSILILLYNDTTYFNTKMEVFFLIRTQKTKTYLNNRCVLAKEKKCMSTTLSLYPPL